ncbi:MAG TPA: hypothetical protein VFO78_04950 [Candidatus Limnocylindrales bacterium]|nr:hypothetical protein [Candidatus Limnocylindrales bacterium]
MSRRPILIVFALAALVALAALPAIAADPSPSASVPPGRVDKPPNPGKGPKGPKAEKIAVSATGTVAASTDADGRPVYTLRSGSTTWTLDAGPAWFHGDDHPLKAYVGKRVTVVGRYAAGSTELDVETVDGATLREPGKPPWAGGWKVVGERHPGWSAEKAERFKAKFGDCFPPGQCKVKPGASTAP